MAFGLPVFKGRQGISLLTGVKVLTFATNRVGSCRTGTIPLRDFVFVAVIIGVTPELDGDDLAFCATGDSTEG